MGTIKVIVKYPDEEYGHYEEIENDLETLKAIVGGFIEIVRVWKNNVFWGDSDERHDFLIILNKEGKLMGLEPNIKFRGDMLVGTIIIAGDAGEDITDVPFDLETWKGMLS